MLKIWKSAKVTALFKSRDKKNMNNFRPISILPAISKVIESVVFWAFASLSIGKSIIVSKTVLIQKKIINHSTTDSLLCLKNYFKCYQKKKKSYYYSRLIQILWFCWSQLITIGIIYDWMWFDINEVV
jgi:hypothetical protein